MQLELTVTEYIFLAASTVQIFYYLIFYSRLSFFKKGSNEEFKFPAISVIIAARNEEKNLLNNLPLILNQNYPEFEVIVVNDCSQDESESIVRSYINRFKNLKIVNVRETNVFDGGKKYALTLGVKAANNNDLVFTDADCIPSSANWLMKMAQQLDNPKNKILLGYGAYKKGKGILNYLIRFDAALIMLQYFSFAKGGMPYMGVGRNLAYKKELFFKNKGFAGLMQVKSGDDDLFIGKTGNSNNTKVLIDQEAFTISKPKKNIRDWYYQKKRHFTTAPHYKLKYKLLLGLYGLSLALFYLSFIRLIVINSNYLMIVYSLFAFRIIIQLISKFRTLYTFRQLDLWIALPILEPINYIINSAIVASNYFSPGYTWKR